MACVRYINGGVLAIVATVCFEPNLAAHGVKMNAPSPACDEATAATGGAAAAAAADVASDSASSVHMLASRGTNAVTPCGASELPTSLSLAVCPSAPLASHLPPRCCPRSSTSCGAERTPSSANAVVPASAAAAARQRLEASS
jgi:hypothetical protein